MSAISNWNFEITIHPETNLVDLRQLHAALESGKDFSNWAKARLSDFEEGVDYISLAPATGTPGLSAQTGEKSPIAAMGRPRKDFGVTIEAAKHIALMERTESGKAVRHYFIECEKQLRSRSSIPQTGENLSRLQILEMALASERRTLLLESKVSEMSPKADFYDTVTASSDVCQIATVCGTVPGLPGRNLLYRRLRSDGVLSSSAARYNLPLQVYIDRGYFTIKESHWHDGENDRVTFTTYVTQKGVDWLRKHYADKVAA